MKAVQSETSIQTRADHCCTTYCFVIIVSEKCFARESCRFVVAHTLPDAGNTLNYLVQ